MITGAYIEQQLDTYRLVRLLGKNASSEIYLGEHVGLHAPVAVKVLPGNLARNDLEKFQDQAHILSQLRHPHIVRVYDFGIQDGTPYLIMNYAPNGNLRQRHLKGSRVPLEIVVSYIKQVASALQYVHEHELIHRDVKPHNMLLGPRDEILLSDFGIATTTHSLDPSLVDMPDFEGTVLYAAPEQLEGKPRRNSDQYALGAVVYEWLSGEWPFNGPFYEVARQHMFDPPPAFSEKGIVDIAPAVEEVVLRALTKDPRGRFGTVMEFADALERVSQARLAFGIQGRPGRQFMSPFPFAV